MADQAVAESIVVVVFVQVVPPSVVFQIPVLAPELPLVPRSAMAAYATLALVGSTAICEVVSRSKAPEGPVESVQVAPASVDIRIPRPKLESSELLASPVPA